MKTGWVGENDGLLVRDINGNGEIDIGLELFGNHTVLKNGKEAANGFEALKDLDSNKDGVFDNRDTAWGEVKIWIDANSNGKSEEGEIITLEEAGIASIDLSYENIDFTDAQGNSHKQVSFVTKADGSVTVKNCFATRNVLQTNYSAGFVGYISGSNAQVENCYSMGANTNGFNYKGTVTNCYFNSDIANSANSKGRTTEDVNIFAIDEFISKESFAFKKIVILATAETALRFSDDLFSDDKV